MRITRWKSMSSRSYPDIWRGCYLACLAALLAAAFGCGPRGKAEKPLPAAVPAGKPDAQDVQALEATWNGGGEGKWEAWDRLRQIYGETNEVDKIFAGTERAVKEGSPYWADYLNYGGMLASQGMVADALAVYDAGLALAPDIYLLLGAKGAAHLMLQQRSQAIVTYERALAVATQDKSMQETHFMLARLLHEDGRMDQARPHYQALSAETMAGSAEIACEIVSMMAEAGSEEPLPASVMFVRDALLWQSAGLAAYRLDEGDLDGGQQILSQLLACGVPRGELESLFDLGSLIRKRNISL
jgi:tetratricopeptide (TPR) repeat protein